MADIVCIGQTVIDVLADRVDDRSLQRGMFRTCKDISHEIGGDAANEARVLKRLGVDVSLVHARGDDNAGLLIKALLERDGVDLSKSIVVPGKKSGSVIITLSESGERDFILSQSIVSMSRIRVTPEMIQGAKIVSLASLFFDPLRDPEDVLLAAKTAKEAGALLSVDVNTSVDIKIADYAEAFSYIDFFLPNDEEAMDYSGKDTVPGAADFFLSMGVKNVIIKTGKEGCYAKNAGGELRAPAFYVENVVDTTGAGDNFAAGFLSSVLRGASLRESLVFACAAASIAIQSVGASTGVKSWRQVMDVIEKHDRA